MIKKCHFPKEFPAIRLLRTTTLPMLFIFVLKANIDVFFSNKELEMYDSTLISKPSILILNKMDTENADEKFEEFMKVYNDYDSEETFFTCVMCFTFFT